MGSEGPYSLERWIRRKMWRTLVPFTELDRALDARDRLRESARGTVYRVVDATGRILERDDLTPRPDRTPTG